MDTKLYKLRAELWLTPKYHELATPPVIDVVFNNTTLFSGELLETTCISIDQMLPASVHQLDIHFNNKTDADTIDGVDKAVIIDRIVFNDIESPKFAWAGIYRPNYPQAWAAEQQSLGNQLTPELQYYTYMGWNGTWSLEFATPIFTWIHKIESHGWIYQ